MQNSTILRRMVWAVVLGTAGAFITGFATACLAQLIQPHVLDFELSGFAGLAIATLIGGGIGIVGEFVGRRFVKHLDAWWWVGKVVVGVVVGTVGMGAVWYLTFCRTSYIPLNTRLWLAVMMLAAGAMAGVLGVLVGMSCRGTSIELRNRPISR